MVPGWLSSVINTIKSPHSLTPSFIMESWTFKKYRIFVIHTALHTLSHHNYETLSHENIWLIMQIFYAGCELLKINDLHKSY